MAGNNNVVRKITDEDLRDIITYLNNGKNAQALSLLALDKMDIMSSEGMADGNVCGRNRAVIKDGKLAYEVDRLMTHYEVEKAGQIRQTLKKFYKRVSYFVGEDIELSSEQKLKVIETVEEVRKWCLDNGFYGKALDFAKLLYKKYKVDGSDTLEKAVRGYAYRQLYRGTDCHNKVHLATKDAQLGRYGIMAKLRGRNYYLDIFNNSKISLPVKGKRGKVQFVSADMSDYKKATDVFYIAGSDKK